LSAVGSTPGSGTIAENAEDDQRADREPEALLEIGRLTELRQADVGGKLVGCEMP
jgi:hypothetical protein